MKIRINVYDLVLMAILFIVMLSGSSCSSAKKLARKEKKAEAFYYNNPEKLAAKAEQMFPNVIGGTTKGTVDTVQDVERQQANEAGDTITITRIIRTHSTDTIRIESGVKIAQFKAEIDRQTAAVEELKRLLLAKEKSYVDMKKNRDNYRRAFFILVAIIGACIAIKFLLKRFI